MAIHSILLLFAAIPTVSGAQVETNWQVNLKTDPMTDESEGSATLIDESGNKLSFSCNGLTDKILSVQFLPQSYLGSSGNIVTIRFDTNPPFPPSLWTYVYKGAYTIDVRYVEEFSKQVGAGERVIKVRALNYENQPVDSVFVSKNGLSAINQIRNACGKPTL